MPEPSFLPDNLIARLGKRLTSNDARLKKALASLAEDFGDGAFLAQHYIQPHAQLELPSQNDSSTRRPVFGLLNEFFGEGMKGNSLVVFGDTGLGKTSLLLMLKLAHLAGLTPNHYDCVLLKLGHSTMESIASLQLPRRTILLVEALPTERLSLAEILQATRTVYRVIITVRIPYALLRKRIEVEETVPKAIYLSPFNPTQTDKYLKRRFQRMKEPNRKRIKGILDLMGPLGGRPFWQNHMDAFVHSRRKSWDAFAAYEALIDGWLDQEQRRQAEKSWRKELALQACLALARNTPGTPVDDEVQAQLNKLECKGRSLLRKGRKGDYGFTHPSIREFLVALGMKNGLPPDKQRIPATDLIIRLLVECDSSSISWQTLDLSMASLAEITLHDADFSKALLESADLTGSAFHRADFSHVQLASCEASEAKFDTGAFDGVKAPHAMFRGTTFSGTRFTNSVLPGSVFARARFDGCQFDHTLLADGDFREAEFGKVALTDCSFKGSTLNGATFQGCALSQVRFDQCSLRGVHFEQCDLEELSLKGADMRTANLDEAFLSALKGGVVKHWKTAAWDAEVAAALRLPVKDNERNASQLSR